MRGRKPLFFNLDKLIQKYGEENEQKKAEEAKQQKKEAIRN